MITISKFDIATLFGLEYLGKDDNWEHSFEFHGIKYKKSDYYEEANAKEDIAEQVLLLIGKTAAGWTGQ